MRYRAPDRAQIDPAVWDSAPLAPWRDYAALLRGEHWPAVAALNALWPADAGQRFVHQDRALLDDGLHYETRIAESGQIATRADNWHDLFNALIWLRYGALKRALNAQQVAEIARVGPRQRSRVQCALTHFDEAGILVGVRDPALMTLWDAHDWHGLFWRERAAWSDGRLVFEVFGHALLEHALTPGKLLVGKAMVVALADWQDRQGLIEATAAAIARGELLRDPQQLRPLPLSGLPGWHARSQEESFYRQGECFQPRRADRVYPPPARL